MLMLTLRLWMEGFSGGAPELGAASDFRKHPGPERSKQEVDGCAAHPATRQPGTETQP